MAGAAELGIGGASRSGSCPGHVTNATVAPDCKTSRYPWAFGFENHGREVAQRWRVHGKALGVAERVHCPVGLCDPVPLA